LKRFAIYGGSFDPPHLCHKKAVLNFLNHFEVEKILLIPTFVSPFKDGFCAPPLLRYEWLKKMFIDEPKVEVLDIEIKKQRAVYTIETVKELIGDKRECGKIYLIMGHDNAIDFHKWNSYEELSSLVEPVVIDRNGERVDGFEFLEFDCPFSSSAFRESLDDTMICEEIREEVMSFYKGKI
jgi:nicotinate-nucleotide adenylyltransferase